MCRLIDFQLFLHRRREPCSSFIRRLWISQISLPQACSIARLSSSSRSFLSVKFWTYTEFKHRKLFDVYGSRFAMGYRHAKMLDQMIKSCESDTSNMGATSVLSYITSLQEQARQGHLPSYAPAQPPHFWSEPSSRAFELQLHHPFTEEDFARSIAFNSGRYAIHPDAILYSARYHNSEVSFTDILNQKRGYVGSEHRLQYPNQTVNGNGFLDPTTSTTIPNTANPYQTTSIGGNNMRDWWNGTSFASANVTLLSPDSGQSGGSSSGPPS